MAQLDDYLQRKSNVLAARRVELEAAPDKALVSISATSRVAGNTGLRPVQMGGHSVLTDSAPGLAGHSLGPSSPEMVLGALASCLVHTYLLQAALLGIALDEVDVEVSGGLDMTRVVGLASDKTVALEELKFSPTVRTPASAADVERLHKAVEETCAVLNTLRQPMTVERA